MDISHSITYHITKCGNILPQLSARKIKAQGIDMTPEESVLLNQLWDKDGQSLSELGYWSIKEPSTLTRQIDHLVDKGYVRREHDEQDRRKILVKLSPKGEKLKQVFEQTGIPSLDENLATISQADIDTTLRVLATIRDKALQQLNKNKPVPL